MGAAWEFDGYAVQIGLRVLGEGHPDAFWRLSREQQLNTLAVLQVEMFTREEDPKDRKKWEETTSFEPEIVGSPEAVDFWRRQLTG